MPTLRCLTTIDATELRYRGRCYGRGWGKSTSRMSRPRYSGLCLIVLCLSIPDRSDTGMLRKSSSRNVSRILATWVGIAFSDCAVHLLDEVFDSSIDRHFTPFGLGFGLGPMGVAGPAVALSPVFPLSIFVISLDITFRHRLPLSCDCHQRTKEDPSNSNMLADSVTGHNDTAPPTIGVSALASRNAACGPWRMRSR